MTKVSIVILNYNGRALLEKFLRGVIGRSREATVVVADNGSTDDSREYLRSAFPDLRLIEIPANLGFCGGYNFALAQIEAEYFVLLNSDVDVTDGWLGPLIAKLDSSPGIAACQPKILAYDNQTHFEYAGGAGGFIDALGYPFCRGRIFDTVEQDTGQYDDSRPVFWATGACLFIRSQAWREMGGLDEDFFAHMEEIDLCWKLNRAGQEVWYVAESKVYHIGGGTLSRQQPHKTFLNFRNGLYLITKNLSSGALLWKLPLRMALDWLATLMFLFQGSAPNAWAVIRAHAQFIVHLPATLRKRALFRHLGFKAKTGNVLQASIVLDYYLRGKKKAGALRSNE